MIPTDTQADEVAIAMQAVSTTPDIMGGMAVFRGTRVPIDIILGSLDEGCSLAGIRESYAFVTEELIAAAKTYAQLHPQRQRARSFTEVHPDWVVTARYAEPAATYVDTPLNR